ncbi:MAG TPA: hypothetical protein VJB16_02870 [archaeon]|nr:hypothetical protein [archaeon]
MRRAAALGLLALAGCTVPGPQYTDVSVDPSDARIDVGLGPRWEYGLAPGRLDLIRMVGGNMAECPIAVVARRTGYATDARQFVFSERPAEIHFQLDPVPQAAGAGTAKAGVLEVSGPPGCRVYLNSEGRGVLPLGPLQEAPGEYVLDVVRPDGTRHQQAIRLTEGGTLRVTTE